MSTQQVQIDVRQVPSWLAEMEFCHIADTTDRFYCGHGVLSDPVCKDYEGEAICPTCGAPTCPRCAQLCALDDSLDAA